MNTSDTFIDGFDHYASSETGTKWSLLNNGNHSMVTGRFGTGQALRITGNNYIEKVFPSNSQAWQIGIAWQLNINASSSIILLKDGGTAQCELTVNSSRQLQITRNGTNVGSAGTTTLSVDTWYYIEWYASIKDSLSSGNCVVMLNGVQEISLSSGDIKNTSNAYADRVALGGFITMTYDDAVIRQVADTTTPTFLGERRVLTLYPDGNGNYSQFTGSDADSVNNYQLVDETLNSTSDYVTTDVVGNKDSYTFGNLPLTPDSITAIQITANLRKDDSGSRTGRLFHRIGGTDYEGSDINLLTTYGFYRHLLEDNPATAVDWTISDVNALESGVKVEA